MRFPGFIGPAYTLKSVNVDCQRCVNLYPEINEMGKGKADEIAWLKSTPGLEKIFTVGDGPIRLVHVDALGRIFVVSGNLLFQMTYAASVWTATRVSDPFAGTFTAVAATDLCTRTAHHFITGDKLSSLTTTGTLPGGLSLATAYWVIRISDDTFKLATSLVNANAGTAINITTAGTGVHTMNPDATAGQILTSTGLMKASSRNFGDSTTSTTEFVDGGADPYIFYDAASSGANWPNANLYFGPMSAFGYPTVANATNIILVDGYFLFTNGTNKFYASDLNGLSVAALSFAGAEGDPDNIIGLISNQRDVWLFGDRSTELFVNTGNADFPFERVGGGFNEKGCLAKFSIAKIDNYVFWLGRDEFGQGVVYAGHGLLPERISTHAIETAIQGYASPSAAKAFTYQSGGHSFYVLNFAEATWVYDLSTKLWHERAYLNAGTLERHRADVHAFVPALNMHIVGDYSTGEVYKFNDDYYSDDGDAIARIRVAPHISNELKRIFYNKLQIDMETGVGLDGGVQGSDPQIIMQFSDDGGHTWSSEAWASAEQTVGAIGAYRSRVIFRRLGKSRDRIFKITITDPVKVALIGAELDFIQGAS